MEIWIDIKGYEGIYQVSNEGRVKSLSNEATRKEKILRQDKSNRYSVVELSCSGIGKPCLVHHLVAEAFVPNPNGYTVVHHINHIKTDNRAENLEWMDEEEHRKIHGLEKKQIYQYTIDGKFVRVWDSIYEAAKVLGVSSGNIGNCCIGGYYHKGKWHNRETCGGYRWSYTHQ